MRNLFAAEGQALGLFAVELEVFANAHYAGPFWNLATRAPDYVVVVGVSEQIIQGNFSSH